MGAMVDIGAGVAGVGALALGMWMVAAVCGAALFALAMWRTARRRARDVYATVARVAWSDGVVSRRERSLLNVIARALGVPRVEAWWIERTISPRAMDETVG